MTHFCMIDERGLERHWSFVQHAGLFMTIKDIVVLKKLSGEEAWAFANGDELMNSLEPGWRGYSYNRLAPYRKSLKRLADAELIIFRKRLESPYGYGDDEQFWISPKALVLIEDQKGNEAISDAVIDKLTEAAGLLTHWQADRYNDE